MSDDQVIYRNTLADMRDGVMVIDLEGTVRTFNRAAETILGLSSDEIVGQRFGEVFFALEGSDDFFQAALDAVYESAVKHQQLVEFGVEPDCRTLAMTTSFLFGDSDEGARTERIGVIAVFSDVTELEEMRDALKAMEEIRRLNGELQRRNEFIQSIFGRYVSEEVVSRLIDEPRALELGGSKQEISLMMTDLRGFTALSERLDPEAVVAMLNHYLSEMTEIIAGHQGTINEFIGDAILVFFGAPIPADDHAIRAVACALEMQLAMNRVNRWNRENGFPAVEMGIGLHTGEVVIGNIGSEKRAKYGAVGSNINLTSRIESYTIGGQILVSERTRELTGDLLEIGSTLEVTPKGVPAPIQLFEALGLGGDFDLRLDQTEDEKVEIDGGMPVFFSYVVGKDIEDATRSARLVALSRHEMFLHCDDESLRSMANVRLQLHASDEKGSTRDEIYGKLLGEEPDGRIRLRMTSVSPSAEAKLTRLMGGGSEREAD